MTKQVQRRRGTATQHTSFTGAEGEISVNTTNKSVHVHDGVTAGGFEAARADLGNVSDASLNTALAGNTLSSLTITSADINGGTIDGTVIGGTTPAAGSFTQANFGDNNKAIFGAGSDLQIYHNGTNSYIEDAGTGSLIVRSSTATIFQGKTAGENQLILNENGAVLAYYDNALKLATTSTGVDVTGTVTADGLVVYETGGTVAEFRWADGVYNPRLFIKGSSEGISLENTFSSAASSLMFRTAGGVLRQKIENTGDISFYEDTGTTPKFFWDASTERLGIGNAAPATALDVTGTVTADGLTNSGSSTLAGNIFFNSTSGAFRFGTDAGTEKMTLRLDGDDLKLENGAGFERVRFTNGGNVGIGTSSPSSALDVVGTVTADGLTVQGDGTAGAATIQGASTKAVLKIERTTTNAGAGYLGASDTEALVVSNSSFANVLSAQSNGDISFYEDTGTTPKLFWDASAEALGIGTSSPNSPLDINTSTSGTQLRLTYPAVRTWNVGTQSGGSFAIRDANAASDRMTITTAGNVGIGTSSPAELIHIAGGAAAAYLKATNSAGTQGIEVGVSSTGDGVVNVQDAKALRLFTTDTERLRIDSSGNVGIGTTSPSRTLSVNGVAGFGNGTIETIISYSDRGIIGTQSNHALELRTNGTERMRIDASGNVGIGTTIPTNLLTVKKDQAADTAIEVSNIGSVGASTTASFIVSETAGSPLGWFRRYRDGTARTNVGYAGNLTFSSNIDTTPVERMRIDSSGNLLVGTTTNTASSKVMISATGQLTIGSQRDGTGTQTHIGFYNPNGQVGSITTSGTATAYNTSSDYRLKESIQPIFGASDRVRQLNPVNFAWKADGSRTDGFIAHEVQEVAPYAVTGEKDGEDMQAMDHSKLVPLLTAALQEALTEIANLKARVAALEA